MSEPMPDYLFKKLSPRQEEKFRKWARDHWVPGPLPDDWEVWHPVVRDEWLKIGGG